MDKHNLEQPATVLWIDRIATRHIAGGPTRHFDRLADAVCFAMQDVPAQVRGTAWIQIEGGSLRIDEIEAIYRDLPPADSE